MNRLARSHVRHWIDGLRQSRWIVAVLAAIAFFTQGCSQAPQDPLEQRAEDFVRIATAVGTYRLHEVDAYFGPEELDGRGGQPARPADLLTQARALVAGLDASGIAASPRVDRLKERAENLAAMLAVSAEVKPPSFADEARLLYGIELPQADRATTERLLKELSDLLPGTGNLALKLASFQNRLVVPPGKRETVFQRALEECKRRTQAHWTLPADEELIVEFTREVDSAWHRYEGAGRSRLQINPLAIAFVGTSLDVACHEGYPGHHAQFLLLEANTPGGLPVEERVVLLRSADSALREGAANYGVTLAWTAEERLAFERDVLFPLAGLSPEQAEIAGKVHGLLFELGAAAIPVLQEYRDGIISFNTATFRLEREAMVPSPGSLLEFVNEHGAYVAGYTVARDRVAAFVGQEAATRGTDAWTVLQQVLVTMNVDALETPLVPGSSEAAAGSLPAS